jgi:hypothetical protein
MPTTPVARPRGSITLVIRDIHTHQETVLHFTNIVTNVGLREMMRAFHGDLFDMPSHLAVGTDPTPPVTTDDSLGGEVEGRVAVSTSLEETDFEDDTIQYVANLGVDDGNGILREVGLFNADEDGLMFARAIFGPVTKTDSMTITVTWRIKIG